MTLVQKVKMPLQNQAFALGMAFNQSKNEVLVCTSNKQMLFF